MLVSNLILIPGPLRDYDREYLQTRFTKGQSEKSVFYERLEMYNFYALNLQRKMLVS
jgi:hypothetical protein